VTVFRCFDTEARLITSNANSVELYDLPARRRRARTPLNDI